MTDQQTQTVRLPDGYRVFVRRATAHAAPDEPGTVLGLYQDRQRLPSYQKCGGGRRIIRKRIGNA